MTDSNNQESLRTSVITLVKSLYSNTRNTVTTGAGHTEEFNTMQGVRQGGILSPLLFITVMNAIKKKKQMKQ